MRQGVARLDRGRVHDRLEGGPGLPERLGRAIELAVVEVAAADHRADLSGLGLDGDDEPLEVGCAPQVAVPLVALRVLVLLVGRVLELAVGAAFDRLQLGLQRALGGLLHVEVERGVDPEPRPVQVRAEARVQLLPHPLDEVLRDAAVVRAGGEQQRVGLPSLGLVRREETVVAQQVQHRVAALDAEVGVLPGIVARRRLGDGGERRGLRDVQVADRLPEVALRRGLHAEGAVAEVDLVEVQLEDLVLGVLLLDLAGDLGLPELAAERFVAAADVLGADVPRQLHRDGREAFGHPHLDQVAPDRAEHAEPVDAVVLVEALVLGGDERGLDHRGHLGQGHDGAPLLAQLGDEAAVGGVDLGGLVRVVAAELVDGGAAVAGTGPGPRRRQDGQHERCHGEEGDHDDATRARREPDARAERWEPAGHGRKLACCGAPFQRVRFAAMTDLLSTLTARGFVQDATPGLAERLSKGRLTAYVGFDPTADSLHVGSLVPVMGLAWLQRIGPHAHRAGGRRHGDGRRPQRQAGRASDADPGADRPQRPGHRAASSRPFLDVRGRQRRPECGTTPTGCAASP